MLWNFVAILRGTSSGIPHMKCPNCKSQMFVTDETATAKSSVTFYRCSICVSEHVSSEPVMQTAGHETADYFDSPGTNGKRFLMV